MKIKDLKPNQNATLEEVEVVEAGDVRQFEKFGKSGSVRTLKIKDSSGEAELSLWNDDVEKFSVGVQDQHNISSSFEAIRLISSSTSLIS